MEIDRNHFENLYYFDFRIAMTRIIGLAVVSKSSTIRPQFASCSLTSFSLLHVVYSLLFSGENDRDIFNEKPTREEMLTTQVKMPFGGVGSSCLKSFELHCSVA